MRPNVTTHYCQNYALTGLLRNTYDLTWTSPTGLEFRIETHLESLDASVELLKVGPKVLAGYDLF